MSKLYHCRVNLLFVRRDADFSREELALIAAVEQRVCEEITKLSGVRAFIEIEPRENFRVKLQSDGSSGPSQGKGKTQRKRADR